MYKSEFRLVPLQYLNRTHKGFNILISKDIFLIHKW